MSWLVSPAGAVASLGLIGDVTSATWVKGDVLVYNGSSWVDLAVGTDTHVLTADSAEATGIKWAAAGGLADVVDDTTPQLGGSLDVNGQTIDFADNETIRFGTGNDVTMSFDGTDMNITGVTATDLNISNGFTTVDCDANVFIRNGHTARVYDAANADFLYLGHDGDNGYIDTAGTGAPGHIELRAQVRVGGDGANGDFIVGDADFSDYLQIQGDGTDINFTITGGGEMDFADHTVRDLVLENLGYTSQSEVVSANAFTITVSEGPAFQVDLEAATAAVTGTISGGPTSGDYGVISVKVEQDSTTAQTLTWAGGTMRWAGGTAHPVTTTVGGFTIYTFETWDGGTIWYGTGADYS